MVQSIFIKHSASQVAKKGAFGEIMPRISGFQGGTYYCQTCHISNNVFSSKYHKIAKIAWFNQFLSSIQLLR